MNKKNYPQIELNCVYQQVQDIEDNQCLSGIISRQGNGKFRFEESVRKGRAPRNPKLYDGKHISMVRMANGKYQFHMKTLSDGFNREKLPFAIYTEMTAALQILD